MSDKVAMFEVFEEIMKKGPYKSKLTSREIAIVKKVIKKRVIEEGASVEDPFSEAVEAKKGIKYEIHRMIKRQREMIAAFNATAMMFVNIEKLERSEDEEVTIAYLELSKMWKATFLLQAKALQDIGKDLLELQQRSLGMEVSRKKEEKKEIATLVDEEMKEKVQRFKEERRTKILEKIAFGRGRGGSENYQVREWRGEGERGRGRGSYFMSSGGNRGRSQSRGGRRGFN